MRVTSGAVRDNGAQRRLNRARFQASRDLAAARSVARTWATVTADVQQADQAALFAAKALRAYAKHTQPDIELSDARPVSNASLDDEAIALAEDFGQLCCTLPVMEALHELTSLYAALLPSARRSELGAFYTPPALASRLADLASEAGLDWTRARVLDPACGGAILLLQAAARIQAALEGSDPAFILTLLGQRLVGLEIDPNAAALAQNAFEIFVAPLAIQSGRKIPQIVRVADALDVVLTEKFDLVIGNPPYGRVRLSLEQRERFARSLYGHANLYGVFTDLAVSWTKRGGYIAYLTPTSVLGGQYYAALRGLLASEAPPVSIDFVHARTGVFEDVMQETMLALYERGASAASFQVHYINLTGRTAATITKNGAVALPPDAKSPWLAPRDPDHAKLIACAARMPARFSDWNYEVSTGPLVWNRFKTQLRDRPGKGAYPLIWAESVTSDGQFVFRALKKNHSPFFKLERGDEWLRITESCVLVQRTTAKEQARRLIAAELPASFIRKCDGVVVENHLNMVRPIAAPKVTPEAVAAILNSPVVDQLFRCISGSVAVSAFELESLPLPSVEAMQGIEALLRQKASRVTVERAIAELYSGEGA
ncbi:MAG: N-6 DNA methylase [Pseudomonadota bacterium]|jgi:adenine-specific DNA-methyltransferase